MNLKKLSISLGVVALGASISAGAAQIIHYGDENDLSWLPGSRATSYQSSSAGASAAAQKSQIIRYGDENDLSWLPIPVQK